MMTLWEAVERRVSCRAYAARRVDAETLQKLEEKLAQLRQQSGLKLVLTVSESEAPAVKLPAAMFVGEVYAAAVFIGPNDPLTAEKIGYYGQEFVLYATQLGLGTCWVAGTYDPRSLAVQPAEGEKVWDVIPLGWPTEKTPMKQKMVRAALRGRDRKPEQFIESDAPYAEVPAWVRKGAEAVRLGPSAVNQQPVNIVYKGGKVSAHVWKDGHGLQHNDMGIAKYNFMVGAAACGVQGHWEFGDGAAFCADV